MASDPADIEPLNPRGGRRICVGANVHAEFWPECQRTDEHVHTTVYEYWPVREYPSDSLELAEFFMLEDFGLDEIEPVLGALPTLLRKDSPGGKALRDRLGLLLAHRMEDDEKTIKETFLVSSLRALGARVRCDHPDPT